MELLTQTNVGFVKETRIGFWFLGTQMWHVRVVSRALNDLQDMLGRRERHYPVILDVGCGQGSSLLELSKRFKPKKIIALDADPHALSIAQKATQTLHTSIEWHQADAASLPFPDQSVDLVFCHQTLHHIVEQENMLRECYRVLKPGGVMMLAESTKAYISSWLILLLFRHPMHVQRTADEYVDMVKSVGFEVGDQDVSTPYLWWSRDDLGMFEWFGFPVPPKGKREETLVNFLAFKPNI